MVMTSGSVSIISMAVRCCTIVVGSSGSNNGLVSLSGVGVDCWRSSMVVADFSVRKRVVRMMEA